jgi:multidrug transporter EmrE-like cation transporter
MNIAWRSLLFGSIMAVIDTTMLGLIKAVQSHQLKSLYFMAIPTVAYMIQPWIFFNALKTESMTVMNLMWDLLSDVLVSLVGIFYFGEKIGRIRTIGLIMAIGSLALLSCDECDDKS